MTRKLVLAALALFTTLGAGTAQAQSSREAERIAADILGARLGTRMSAEARLHDRRAFDDDHFWARELHRRYGQDESVLLRRRRSGLSWLEILADILQVVARNQNRYDDRPYRPYVVRPYVVRPYVYGPYDYRRDNGRWNDRRDDRWRRDDRRDDRRDNDHRWDDRRNDDHRDDHKWDNQRRDNDRQNGGRRDNDRWSNDRQDGRRTGDRNVRHRDDDRRNGGNPTGTSGTGSNDGNGSGSHDWGHNRDGRTGG